MVEEGEREEPCKGERKEGDGAKVLEEEERERERRKGGGDKEEAWGRSRCEDGNFMGW